MVIAVPRAKNAVLYIDDRGCAVSHDGIGMGLQRGDARCQASGCPRVVRGQIREVRAAGQAQSFVQCRGQAAVGPNDEPGGKWRLCQLPLDHPDGTVPRSVIDHDELVRRT